MITKTFEIRDKETTIPVMATKIYITDSRERTSKIDLNVFAKAGYHGGPSYVILTTLFALISNYDMYNWGKGRTMHVAHNHIQTFFDELASGSVVDVQFILGETKESKKSECNP